MSRAEFSQKTKDKAWERAGGRCEASGCRKPVFRRTYCTTHYTRFIRHGDVSATSRPANGDPLRWVIEQASHQGTLCLIFPFKRHQAGYGRVTKDGKRMGAHHAMCLIAHGPMPTPKHQAAHSCGKGEDGCVNPHHLRWATVAENLEDRIAHGTANRGERHGNSRFTESDIRKIRTMASAGVSQAAIAEAFATGQGTIGKILRGERWGWLT